jgi:hypothetical protein
MKALLRSPLVSIAALAGYLAVHVFACALHHHHGMENRPASLLAACEAGLQIQAAGTAENDQEETCLLCSVLHSAQSAPTTCHFEAVAALVGKAFSTVAIIRPYPIETVAHSRAPPLI